MSRVHLDDGAVFVAGRRIPVNKPDKQVLHSPDGAPITRLDVISYYLDVADFILPHLTGRCLTAVRYTRGVAAGGFYVKNAPDDRPAWMSTLPSPTNIDLSYLHVEDAAGLAWLGSIDAIEMHAPIAFATRPDVEALGAQVASFSAAELFTLFQQSGIEADTPEISGLLTAVSLGTLSADDLQDYAAGKPSRTTDILDAPELAYTDDRSLPAFQQPTWYGGGAVTATDDTEAAEFLIASGTARLLDAAYRDVEQAPPVTPVITVRLRSGSRRQSARQTLRGTGTQLR